MRRHVQRNGVLASETLKRAFDVVFAVCVLIPTSPAMLLGALVVKLTSPGPAIYRARRAGLRGTPFVMFKLRTMRVASDYSDRRVTAADDARITPVGQWLRKFQIDELPQFWNVLRGEMSVVGPRPEDYDLVQQHYTPAQWRTLEVRPGIVSPADINWYPNLTYHDPPPAGVSMQEHYLRRHLAVQLADSLCYVDQRTMLVDLRVIAQTIFCVLVRSWLPPKKKPLPAPGGGRDVYGAAVRAREG